MAAEMSADLLFFSNFSFSNDDLCCILPRPAQRPLPRHTLHLFDCAGLIGIPSLSRAIEI